VHGDNPGAAQHLVVKSGYYWTDGSEIQRFPVDIR